MNNNEEYLCEKCGDAPHPNMACEEFSSPKKNSSDAKVLFTSKNIIRRFKKAFNKLADCDEELGDFKRTMTDEQWSRFTSHASGFICSSLMSSEKK